MSTYLESSIDSDEEDEKYSAPLIDSNDSIYQSDNPFANDGDIRRADYYYWSQTLVINLAYIFIVDYAMEDFEDGYVPLTRTQTVAHAIEFINSIILTAQKRNWAVEKIEISLRDNVINDDGIVRIVDFLKQFNIPFELDIRNNHIPTYINNDDGIIRIVNYNKQHNIPFELVIDSNNRISYIRK